MDKEWWKSLILRPITQGDKERLTHLRVLIMHLCLRRTKQCKHDGKLILTLPPKELLVRKVALAKEEVGICQI